MKVEQLEYLFSNINRWISNADGKVNIFIGVQLAVIGIFSDDFTKWYTSHFFDMTVTELVISTLGLVAVLYSIFNSIKGIFPNLKSLGKNGELVYFGSVTKHTLGEFQKIVDDSTDKQYRRDLVEQIYTNSHIANTKFAHYKNAVLYFLAGVVTLIFIYLAV